MIFCEKDTENINLLRKTSLSILSEELLNEMFSGFKTTDIQQFNLSELKTKIPGSAVIAIYV